MRKILIVIDMQNDFIDAALGSQEAVSIVEAVKDKIRSYPAADVIATMDTHGDNYMNTQEGKYLPVPHCIKGTDGWQIRPDIAELLTGAAIYEKPTFGSTALAADLKAISEKEEIELELIGLIQRASSQSDDAGSQDLGRSRVLRRRDAGETSCGSGDDAFLPDPGGMRMGEPGVTLR